MSVKKLVWSGGRTQYAYSILGGYTVWELDGSGLWAFRSSPGTLSGETIEDAKAAAQSHFDAAIASVLEDDGWERKRAIAAIHWVFNADGTVGERAMAQEAIHKISDPTFMPSPPKAGE